MNSNKNLLCLATPPSGWLGPDEKAFSSFRALLPYVSSRFNTLWINPRLASLPTPRDKARVFLQKLRNLVSSVVMQAKVTKSNFISLEPLVPYTEFYISRFKGYDKVYIHYWSIIARIVAKKVKNVLKILRPEFCFSTHIFGGLLGSVLKEMNLTKYHVYYDLDEFSAIPPFDTEISEQIAYLEREIIRKADVIWSVSKTLADRRRVIGAKKILIVPHGVHALFAKAAKLRTSISASNLKKSFSIVYTGTIHPNWGVDVLLEAFDFLMKKKYNMKLILAGPATDSLLKRIKILQSKHSKNIQYLGVIHWSELYKVLAMGDIGVAPYRTDGSAAYGVPLKIKEYVTAGLPVISTCVGEIPIFLEKTGVGITCQCSPKELAETIIRLIENTGLRETMMKNAIQLKIPRWEQVFDEAFEKTFKVLEKLGLK